MEIKSKAKFSIKIIFLIISLYISLLLGDIILSVIESNIFKIPEILSDFQVLNNPLEIYDSNSVNIILFQAVITLIVTIFLFKEKLSKIFKPVYHKFVEYFMIEERTKRKLKKRILTSFIYLMIAYIFLLFSDFWYQIQGEDLEGIYHVFSSEFQFLVNPFAVYEYHYLANNLSDLLIVQLIPTFFVGAIIYYQLEREGEFHLEEKGSAEWGTAKDRIKYGLHKKEGNIILSQTEYLPLNMREIFRNVNIYVEGGSGTGKTRYFVKPNLMQLNSSYVITDPKGELYRDSANMLMEKGYDVKILNLKDPKFSEGYNPFNYIAKDDNTDIEILAETIMKNTVSDNSKGDQFWENSSKALLTGILHYVNRADEEDPKKPNPSERNLSTVFELILAGRMENEGETTELDEKFTQLDNSHPAKKYYKIFQLAPMKTRNSILISLGTQLAFLSNPDVENIIVKDTLDLRNHHDKRAIFLITPDSNNAYGVLASIFYTQFFQILYEEADSTKTGELNIHHQFILDEFANIGKIPKFDELIATMRSRKISAIPIIQNQAQLENLYKDNMNTIIGNCDTVLYLGGSDEETAENFSKRLGQATIQVQETSIQKNEGQSNSVTKNQRKDSRDLMTTDEILQLDDHEMLISIRGFKPFKSKKFDLTGHENYDLLSSVKIDYTEKYDENANVKKMKQKEKEERKKEKEVEVDVDMPEILDRGKKLLSEADKLINEEDTMNEKIEDIEEMINNDNQLDEDGNEENDENKPIETSKEKKKGVE